MFNVIPIIKKELKSYFNSPIAYIVVIVFLLFTSIMLFFLNQFFAANRADLRAYFGMMPVVFMILMPALTMRSWAEETKQGTAEILLTLPFREYEVVLGKFLAAGILLVVMMVLTLPVPLSLSPLGNFEIGQIVGQYFGMFLLGLTGIAVGMFISSITRNQISSFIFGLVVLLFLTLINQVNVLLNLPGPLARLFQYISFDSHFSSFSKGLLDSRDMFYFILVGGLFLYFNIKVLVFRKWS